MSWQPKNIAGIPQLYSLAHSSSKFQRDEEQSISENIHGQFQEPDE